MRTGKRRIVAMVGTSLALLLAAILPVQAANPSKYDVVQAIFSWTRVDENGTWAGSMAMFGPHGSSLGTLSREFLVPITHQCTGQGTPGDPSDDTFADITGESRPGQTATTAMTIASNLKSASYSGPMQANFFVKDGCSDEILASGSWTKDVELTLTAVGKFRTDLGTLRLQGYLATGVMTFDGVAAAITYAEIARGKG